MQDAKGHTWCENNIVCTKPNKSTPDSRGIGYVYFQHMIKNKESLAQIDGVTGKEDTFGALLQRCVRTSIALQEMGLKYGDVISVCSYNHLNSCVPHLVSFFTGAKMAALDPTLSHREAVHLCRQVMPKFIFTVTESVQLIEGVAKEIGLESKIVVFGPTTTHIPFDDLIQSKPDEMNFKPVEVPNIHDVALILFSSGTTGLPKGICHTHYSILKAVDNMIMEGPPSVLMFVMDSPYWNIFTVGLQISIINNWTRLAHPCVDETDFWKILKYKINIMFAPTTPILSFCKICKPNELDLSSLSCIKTGGSPITENHIMMIQNTFPNALIGQIYGQTETLSAVTCFNIKDKKQRQMMLEKKNSCGLLKQGIWAKVVDPDTEQIVGPNQKGEIRLKTEVQLSGYYNMDSTNVWDDDGWLKTGDYGYYDDECCFYVIDRIKEMFKYRYKHIAPAFIEDILKTHPSIWKAVVIGKPHYIDNYHPLAVVILKPNVASVTPDEIEKYVEERLEDPYRLRGGVQFVKSFPMTPSGKIRRLVLKQMILPDETAFQT